MVSPPEIGNLLVMKDQLIFQQGDGSTRPFFVYCVPRIFVDTLSLQPSLLPLSRRVHSGPHSTLSNQDVMRRLVISAPNIDTSHNGSPALRHLRSEVRRILLETDWTTKPIHNLYIFRSGLQSVFRQRIAFKISSIK